MVVGAGKAIIESKYGPSLRSLFLEYIWVNSKEDKKIIFQMFPVSYGFAGEYNIIQYWRQVLGISKEKGIPITAVVIRR